MSLLALFVIYKEDDTKIKILQNEFDLTKFGFFERHPIKQFLIFSARTVVERAAFNTRQSIEQEEKINGTIHVYVRSDGLASVLISKKDYPTRVAHTLLSKITTEFNEEYTAASWKKMNEGSGTMASLNQNLMKYQDPTQADALMNLQKNLDETKDILVNTMENLLRRGETIDNLVARSADLDFQTKQFYKHAKKTNQCCSYY